MRTRTIRVDHEVAAIIEQRRQKLEQIERRYVTAAEAVRTLVIPIEDMGDKR